VHCRRHRSGGRDHDTIVTTSGTALNVANTSIGSDGLTFQSISANGAVNGIVLNSTGSNTFAVTGTDGIDGGIDPDAGTGGTIQAPPDTPSADQRKQRFAGRASPLPIRAPTAINMTGGSNLTLQNGTITNIGNGDNDNAMTLTNVGGTVSIQDSTFNNVAEEFIESTSLNTNLTMNVTTARFTQPKHPRGHQGGWRPSRATASSTRSKRQPAPEPQRDEFDLHRLQDCRRPGGSTQSGGPNASNGSNTNVTIDNSDFLVTITNSSATPTPRQTRSIFRHSAIWTSTPRSPTTHSTAAAAAASSSGPTIPPTLTRTSRQYHFGTSSPTAS